MAEVASGQLTLIRTSERKLFTACRQAWWWSYVERLHPRHEGPALRFGDLAHQALAAYYIPGKKRGPHPAKTFAEIYDNLDEPFLMKVDDERTDARALGIEVMEHYIEYWGKDLHIRIIAPEMPAQVDVFDKNGRYMCTYVLKFDAVYQDLNDGLIGLLEHKTAASISTVHLPLDEQGGSYFTFAPDWLRSKGILKPKQDIDKILYNFLRKAFRDQRPVNALGQRLNKPTKEQLMARCGELNMAVAGTKVEDYWRALTQRGERPELLGSVSKSQPPPFFVRQPIYRNEHDRANVLYRVRAQAWEMGQVKAGKMPLYKNPTGSYPDQHCKGCGFRDMCELHETGADWEAYRDATMTTWNPYEDHDDAFMTEEDE